MYINGVQHLKRKKMIIFWQDFYKFKVFYVMILGTERIV